MKRLWLGALTVLYPFMVAYGSRHVQARWLALGLLALACTRIPAARHDPIQRAWLLGMFALAAVTLMVNGTLPLKLYPVSVNLIMLCIFGISLLHPPTVVERIARLTEPDLPAQGVAYTRRVTQVWCAFFTCNGLIALYTVLYCSDHIWALYNGLIAYILIGTLFGVEWLVRQRVRRGYTHV